ncbi:MAG TPA: hypothetical protein VF168_00290 [Trueperaceae bacterium]
MNRQFRRAQEKQDKKQQKEKTRRREERKAKVSQMRQARRQRSDAKQTRETGAEKAPDGSTKPTRGRAPGRFSGVLAAVTVFFITLQGTSAEEEDLVGWQEAAQPFVYPAFYLMLGYFATLWFMRRGTDRAALMSVLGGVLLAIGVTVARLVQDLPLEPLPLVLILPALVLGAYLGRLVFIATPR